MIIDMLILGKKRKKQITDNTMMKCPNCAELIKKEGEAVWRCPNPDCPAKKKELLYHFVSKKAFDIQGLGPKIIDQLLDEGLISDPADLFELREGDLIPLERFAEKTTT